MKLMKAHQFRREFFEAGSRPSKSQILSWIELGELPGLIIDDEPYVDIHNFVCSGPRHRAKGKTSGIELLR